MLYFGATPTVFFYYQLLVAVIEFGVLAFKAYALLPPKEKPSIIGMDWQAMVPTLRFTMGISFLSVAWIVMSQTDKLLLSRMLSLSDYGHFTLAALGSSAIMLASGPISTALLPRLSRLHAEHKAVARDALYRTATRLVAAVVFPIAMTMALFAYPILLAWTGDSVLARETQYVLSLYSIGNAFLVMAAFPYYLQYAHGSLKLHMYGSLLFLAFLIPALIWLTGTYGMTGAGVAWLTVNLVYLLAWVPVVHRRLLHKQHLDWIVRDVLMPAVVSLLVLAPLAFFLPPAGSRLMLILQISIYLGLSLIACCRPAIKAWKSLSESLPEAQKRL
jgi:O-antigen/teichoic acid export membrane protein